MDRGAEWDGEDGDALPDAIPERLLERHGDGGGRRLCAKGGGVSRQHVLQEPERILARYDTGYAELDEQQHNVQHEDDEDDPKEHGHDAGHLSADGDVEEDAEDVERQEGHDDSLDEARDDVTKVYAALLERVAGDGGEAETNDEGEQKGGHNVHHGRHGNGKVGREHGRFGVLQRLERLGANGEEVGEDRHTGEVGEETGEDGRSVGDERRDEQQPPRALA